MPMGIINFLTNYLIIFTQATLVMLLGLILANTKIYIRKILIVSCLYAFLAQHLPYTNLNAEKHTLLHVIFLFLLLKFFMPLSYKTASVIVLSGTIIHITVGLIVAWAILPFGSIQLQSIIYAHILSFIIETSIIMIYLVIKKRRPHFYIFGSITDNLSVKNLLEGKFFLLTSIFLFQCLLICLFSCRFSENTALLVPHDFLTAIIATIFIPLAIVLVLNNLTKILHDEAKYKDQIQSLKAVEELLISLRIQRHDLCHDFQVVYGLIEVAEFEEAKKYIKKSISELCLSTEFVKMDNLPLAALLFLKKNIAEGKNISFNITTLSSLKSLNIEVRDINIILGNLIDNAIDACLGTPYEKKQIDIIISYEADKYIFEVINYYSPIGFDLKEKIFSLGYTTKKNGAGIGLYSVQKLLQKYNGRIELFSNDQSTCFKIVIPTER
ncbi:sensor kinase SpoOB-type protein [Anaerobacterium chartisolvens]|uniref:Sensor kinase SpoOB-type protein n=1 Tax=Anaerobacterium chartisolvens TaxID=1297424 RepID=A0A369B4Q5_9FIRM|nr:GHKL domain-containing protein [Anaerobacterium chartisolvens]RCX16522.1 sensor kinase SpoOB-type protein [Anaerobacterium chartisolvens]